MSIDLGRTREFDAGARRAILSSGQAVVLHRLAIMSKDGDRILAETDEALVHVLGVLGAHGARCRFGAPPEWLRLAQATNDADRDRDSHGVFTLPGEE